MSFLQNAVTVAWFSLIMVYVNMETQKIVNLLNDSGNESPKFATRKWYDINDQNNTEYGEGNENDSRIKFEPKVIKSSLWDYSDEYIPITGDITATDGDTKLRLHLKVVLHLQDV